MIQAQLSGKWLIVRVILFVRPRDRLFGWGDLFRFRNVGGVRGPIPIMEEADF
jgi:hypothetical protein